MITTVEYQRTWYVDEFKMHTINIIGSCQEYHELWGKGNCLLLKPLAMDIAKM